MGTFGLDVVNLSQGLFVRSKSVHIEDAAVRNSIVACSVVGFVSIDIRGTTCLPSTILAYGVRECNDPSYSHGAGRAEPTGMDVSNQNFCLRRCQSERFNRLA